MLPLFVLNPKLYRPRHFTVFFSRHFTNRLHISRVVSVIQPGVRVPLGVRDDMLNVGKIKKNIYI